MKLKREQLSTGFILAGMMNIVGVFLFSKVFTNAVITQYDAQAMSNFGLLMIVVWGFAYIAVAKQFHHLKWLIAVFTIEKLIYATHWTNWILNNKITEVLKKDSMAGIFYAIYGINDWVCFFFFLFVFIQLSRKRI